VNKGAVCIRRLRPPISVIATTMVIVTTMLRPPSGALPPIPWWQNTGRLFITDLPTHRRRPYPSVEKRRITTLIRPGERCLHGGKACVPTVSYLLTLCSMANTHPRASMQCRQAWGMLYRATT
jgi:hypothetical protein